ncbi:MAG: antibiotic biosynthesis monooxygenase [Ktedonobacteraceae bacterium]|nr:antibiotic biosynthesis monooxygenase [Chloroflexota bacterium]
MFVRTVTVIIPTGREDEMYAFWEWASTFVRRQPGYIRGQLWRDTADPQQFTELHIWQRAEDSATYRATEQFRVVIERLVALSEMPPRAAGYYVERE